MTHRFGPRGPPLPATLGCDIRTRGVVASITLGRLASARCRPHSRPTAPRPPSCASASRPSAAAGPFLVFRDGDGAQRLLRPRRRRDARQRRSRRRATSSSLHWDTEVSRLHAELERIAGEWTVSDDGLSRNGTFVNGARISGRTRLRDGDVLRVGQTVDRLPPARGRGLDARRRSRAAGSRSPTCRRPSARCSSRCARPYKHDEFATPATNQEIADELFLSVDAVKSHLRTLFARFGDRAPAAEPEALAAGRRGAAGRRRRRRATCRPSARGALSGCDAHALHGARLIQTSSPLVSTP